MSEKSDVLGRTHSEICGWLPSNKEIPVGSEVVLHGHSRSGRQGFAQFYAGHHAVVTAFHPCRRRIWTPTVTVRVIEPVNAMEAFANFGTVDASQVEVVRVGDGTVVPGESYQLCKIEVLRKRFAEMDHRYEGFKNPATYLAHLYLRTDAKHHQAVLGMIRSNFTINPTRLGNYFRKEGLKIDDWAWVPEGFPPHHEFSRAVAWEEVAEEFLVLAREQAA